MNVPITSYRTVPRDSIIVVVALMVLSLFFCRYHTFFGIIIGGLTGIGSYISIMLMVSLCLGMTKTRIRWVFPLIFVFKYAALLVILYYAVTTPQINILGFFAGFSVIFFVIFWKGIMNLWYMFSLKENEKGCN